MFKQSQGFRVVTLESVIRLAQEGRLSWQEAATALRISARHLRRLRRGYEARGRGSLVDGRSLPRGSRVGSDIAARMCALKRGMYSDFTVSHFYDIAVEQHGLLTSYSWLLRTLQKEGVVEKAKRRGTYRRRRPRQPMIGMRVHTDGSTHPWLGVEHPVWDLVIMLDDADGRLLAARFVPQESVLSTFLLLGDVLRKYGRFAELYHDRGSMYCHTSDAGVGPDPRQSGQVPRALSELGIKQIWAYSPQARGRCERAFGTLQERLCAELALHKITDYETANAYLQDVFMPAFNQRFTVTPTESESAFVALNIPDADLKLILSVQHERTVKNDYTISFERQILQLPEPSDKRYLQKQKVIVHEHTDGTLVVSHQGKVLAYFKADVPWYQLPGYRHREASNQPSQAPTTRYQPPPVTLDQHLNANTDPVVSRHDLFRADWT